MPKDSITYSKSGVDINIGDQASEILYKASKKTWKNRKGLCGEVNEEFQGFFSFRGTNFSGLPPGVIGGHNQDGIGTKIEIAERTKIHTTMAFDLLAMVCDDASVRGCEPLLVGSCLSFNKVDIGVVTQLSEGLISAAKEARVAVTNGELAELGNRVGGYGQTNYNWEGTVFWLGREDRICQYSKIKKKLSIVAFRENGFRSNGLSLVRRIFQSKYGSEWHNTHFQGQTLGMEVLTPSKIYSRAITDITGGVTKQPACETTCFVHITGGGIPGKLGRALVPTGLGARLENLFPAPPIMLKCKSDGNVSDMEAYGAWNMGNGLLCITSEPQTVIAVANSLSIEAQVAGEVTSGPTIELRDPINGQELIFTAGKR
jgi:phosphoribosylformylglycinamidine cyclo-ligase